MEKNLTIRINFFDTLGKIRCDFCRNSSTYKFSLMNGENYESTAFSCDNLTHWKKVLKKLNQSMLSLKNENSW